MKRVLIDTDILIDFLREKREAKKVIESVISEQIIGMISVITESELFSGKECNNSEKRKAVEDLLLLMNKIDVDSDIAKKGGELRRTYDTPLLDSLIAATAILTNAIVYTRNRKHFQHMKEVNIATPYG